MKWVGIMIKIPKNRWFLRNFQFHGSWYFSEKSWFLIVSDKKRNSSSMKPMREWMEIWRRMLYHTKTEGWDVNERGLEANPLAFWSLQAIMSQVSKKKPKNEISRASKGVLTLRTLRTVKHPINISKPMSFKKVENPRFLVFPGKACFWDILKKVKKFSSWKLWGKDRKFYGEYVSTLQSKRSLQLKAVGK